jgi:hypothetical protein
MSDHIVVIDITRKRGDNFPFQFTLTDEAGVPIDITGFSFRMVVDPSNAPGDALGNILDLTGVLVTPAGGVFQFEPTTVDMNITPETYFHEVQMIDAAAKVRTIVQGTFIIEQDIVK